MAKLVSKTYGDALFQLAAESQRLDEFWEEVKDISRILKENEELSKLMSHPQVVKEEKVNTIKNIFSGKISEELVGLMVLLIRKNRFGQIGNVFGYFIDQVKEYKNIGTAVVTSPRELREEQKEEVKAKLLETTKYVEFEITYEVKEELIGGMIIRIGDRVVDSSVKTKLYQMAKELSKIQLKAGECAP